MVDALAPLEFFDSLCKLLLLPRIRAAEFTHTDPWRLMRIMGEFIEGFDTLATVEKVVTIFGAEAIGIQRDVGSLEAGKMADLIVLDRNPLENIKNTNSIRYVMKNGELYEGDTLNMVWPESKPLPKQFWWDT